MRHKSFTPAIEEYNLLRQEINNRISIVNSQAHTAILTILTVWGTGFLLLANTINIIETDVSSSLHLMFLLNVAFLSPILYFIPLSIKSGENIIQITSIAAYIMVFYEYKSVKNKNKFCCWELSNNKTNELFNELKKKKNFYTLYNEEYTLLSCCSLLISIIVSVYFFNKVLSKCLEFEIVICVIFFLSTTLLGVFGCIIIHKKSYIKDISKKKTKYLQDYIDIAYKIGFYSKIEYNNACDYFKLNTTLQ